MISIYVQSAIHISLSIIRRPIEDLVFELSLSSLNSTARWL